MITPDELRKIAEDTKRQGVCQSNAGSHFARIYSMLAEIRKWQDEERNGQ